MQNWKFLFLLSLCYLVQETKSTSCYYKDAYYGTTEYKYCSIGEKCCGTFSYRYCCDSYYYTYTYVSDTLSAGIIAAIVIGCLVPIFIIAAICFCVCCAASRRNGARGVVVGGQTPTVTTVNTSSNNLVAPPPYPGQQMNSYPQPGPAYGVQSGFTGQNNPAYPQYPEPGKY